MLVRFALATLLALAAVAPADAQPQRAQLATLLGSVADAETGDPLPSATIALYTGADSTFVTGTTTAADGTFRLEGLRPSEYWIRVSFIGYVTERTSARLAPRGEVDLGRVELAPNVAELDGAQVVGERVLIEQRADRTVYNVKDQPVTAGGNALNTLETLPSVEVDQDGTVSLRGGQNVAIQINGRPTPISGAFLAAFLRQIPAETIDRVEVVPTPGASEEASGMSGIINIILKEKAPDRGLAGGASLTGGTQEAGINANLSYNRGAYDVSGSYGFGGQRFDGIATADRTYRTDTAPFASFDRDEPNERSFGGHFGNVTLDYTLSPRSVLSFNANASVRDSDNSEVATTRFRLRSGADSTDVRDVTRDDDGSNLQGSVRFDQRLDEDGQHTLTAELRASRNTDDADELTQVRQNDVATSALRYLEDRTVDELTAELDYKRPLGPARVEAGARAERESIDDTASLFDELLATDELSGAFDYGRTVLAAYAQAAVPLGANVEVQGGLRVETTDRDFDLVAGGFGGDDETTSTRYTDLFPSAFAVYTFSPGTLLKGAYSRRINRPSTRFLSPFNSQADPFTQRRGNADLLPEYTDAFELTAQYKFFATLTPFYRRTTDVIQRTFRQEGETTIFTAVNAGTQNSYGADVTLAAGLPGFPVRGFVSGSVFKEEFSGVNNAFENTSYSLRTSLSAELTRTTSLSFFGFFRGPRAIEDGSSSGFGFTTFALSQKLRGDQLVLNLRASDPFSTTRFEFDTANAQFEQLGAFDPDRQSVAATLTWTFGEQQRRRRSQGQQPQGGAGGGDDFGI